MSYKTQLFLLGFVSLRKEVLSCPKEQSIFLWGYYTKFALLVALVASPHIF